MLKFDAGRGCGNIEKTASGTDYRAEKQSDDCRDHALSFHCRIIWPPAQRSCIKTWDQQARFVRSFFTPEEADQKEKYFKLIQVSRSSTIN